MSEATILYVDDTEAQRYALSRVLRRAGFEVLEANTGRQALEMTSTSPDLVVLDVNLPDINGIEVCKQIKSNEATAHTPVMQVSATLVDTQARVAGLEGGADAYLVQPIEPRELIATVRALLRVSKAEESARRQAREIEAIYTSAPVGLAMFDTDLRFTRVNRLLAEINGLSAEDHIGRTLEELSPELESTVGPLYRRVLATGEPVVNVEVRTGRPPEPGVMRDWLLNLHPLKDETGRLLGVNAVVQDVTSRKQAEEETRKSRELFQAFMDNLPVCAYMRDKDGRYLFFNRAAKDLSTDLDNVAERTDSELFPASIAEAFHRKDQEVLESGKPLELTERTVHNGQERHWLSIKFPFTDSAGQVLLAGMSLDITARKQLEDLSIRQEIQRRLLEHALLVQEDERRRIARELHDEAGQLMTSLLVGLRSLSDARRLADVKTQANRLREIASDAIGELGRLAQGLHSSVLDDLGLEAAIRRYADDFSKANSIALQIEFHDAPLASFNGNDQLNLYRIVQEALTNVARHSHARKVSIKFSCDPSGLQVTIHDDGQGLAVSRASGNTAGHLGIEGMRQRAAMLGGTLRVISDPEGGTTVELRAPCGEVTSGQE